MVHHLRRSLYEAPSPRKALRVVHLYSFFSPASHFASFTLFFNKLKVWDVIRDGLLENVEATEHSNREGSDSFCECLDTIFKLNVFRKIDQMLNSLREATMKKSVWLFWASWEKSIEQAFV
jgi:hypothetical protein